MPDMTKQIAEQADRQRLIERPEWRVRRYPKTYETGNLADRLCFIIEVSPVGLPRLIDPDCEPIEADAKVKAHNRERKDVTDEMDSQT